MRVKEIGTLLYMDIGAPAPIIISDEYKLNLLYYYDKEVLINSEYPDLPKERNIQSDTGIAMLFFHKVVIHKFGFPNDEVLLSHPYYSCGLQSYGFFELEKSDWIDAIVKMNRVHPFHNPDKYKSLKHYLITFKGSTFECIATGVEIKFVPAITMKEALQTIDKNFT